MISRFFFVLFFSIISLTQAFSQAQFSSPIPNPDGIQIDPHQYFIRSEFHDLGNDGDMDIFATSYDTISQVFEHITYNLNSGTEGSAEFDSLHIIHRHAGDFSDNFKQHTYGDIDNDGDIDVLQIFNLTHQGTRDKEFVLYPNKSQDSLHLDTPIINPYNLVSYKSDALVTFTNLTDFGNDGDLDLVVSEMKIDSSSKSIFRLIYFQNVGTPEQAEFQNPITLDIDTASFQDILIPTFGDIDGDGDIDMLAINYDNDNIFASYVYYENTSNTGIPSFTNPVHNPFNLGLISGIEMTTPTLTDYDNDGDLDLFVTSTSDFIAGEFVMPKTQLFLNNEVSKVEVPNFKDAGITIYPNPATDIIHISSDQVRTGNLILYTMQGKVIQHKMINGSLHESMNISNLPSGKYILYLEDQNIKASKILIIE